MGDQWCKGVAIPLQHGTVVAWDARLLQHCTTVPILKILPHCAKRRKTAVRKSNSSYSSILGTCFNIHKGMVNGCREMKRKAEEDPE